MSDTNLTGDVALALGELLERIEAHEQATETRFAAVEEKAMLVEAAAEKVADTFERACAKMDELKARPPVVTADGTPVHIPELADMTATLNETLNLVQTLQSRVEQMALDMKPKVAPTSTLTKYSFPEI